MFTSIWGLIFGIIIKTAISGHSLGANQTIPPSPSPTTTQTSPSASADVPAASVQPEQLAKCLTAKGVRMYGAYWCPHCADQKKLFADAFQYIKYTECAAGGPNADPAACDKAGVESYPTWTIPGGKTISGTQPLADLAKWANCQQ